MKYLLALILFSSCATLDGRNPKLTVGQEICSSACQAIGGEYHTMTEEPRKCYCVFTMPEYRLEKGQQRTSAKAGEYAEK